MTRAPRGTVLYAIDALGEGGTELSLAELLPFVSDAGYHPVVTTLKSRGREGVEDELRAAGFDLRQLPGPGALRQVAALRRLIAAERPVLVHTMLYQATMVARLATATRSVPVLTSLVTLTYSPYRRSTRPPSASVSSVKAAVARGVDRASGRLLTGHFHAVSEAVRREAETHMRIPPSRVTVVHRGRGTERLGRPGPGRRARARATFAVPADAPLVVNVGRQEPAKDHRTLLCAARHLQPQRPDLIFIVAGREGRASSALDKQWMSLPDPDRFRFVGHRPDVADLLAAADVFVLPSLYEGLPGAVLEAMALELPIVASDIEPVREVVESGGNALVFPPGDATALATAITTLLDDPERRKAFGRRSGEIFHGSFTRERSAEQMLALYHRLIVGSG
jgi:glycosyltransferase involved in cell wall biosynthesis